MGVAGSTQPMSRGLVIEIALTSVGSVLLKSLISELQRPPVLCDGPHDLLGGAVGHLRFDLECHLYLRESRDDKERFHRTAVMQLQQQYLAVQAKLDKAYDDRLAGRITDELWGRKSAEWEAELSAIRRETARHERASHDYAATGSKILELAKNAHNLFIRQDPREQARLLKTLVSNSTFDRGSLSVAYVKPFDLLVEGNETGNWLGGRDSNPDNGVQSAVSYR